MTWQTLVGVGGAVLAVCGYLWYKVRQAASAQADAATAQAQVAQAEAARTALEAQARVKAAQEQDRVQNDVNQALAKPADQRVDAALDVLRAVRGRL